MKKRVLSLFMALALCFSMLPTAALAEEADAAPDGGDADSSGEMQLPGTHTAHCVCGKDSGTKVNGHTHSTNTAWNETTSLPNSAGSYYLTKPVSGSWTVPKGEVNLCLNGQTINGKITVGSGATLTLTDCSSDNSGKIQGEVLVNGGKFELYSGTITGGVQVGINGGSYQTGSSFTMYGGAITGNEESSGSGGGVFLVGTKNQTDPPSFTMHGGTISNNTAGAPDGGGGGVYVGEKCSFTMDGGTITGNTATNGNGGGIYIHMLANVTISGGEITNNKAPATGDISHGHGGGIYSESGVTVKNVTITGNNSNFEGGGIYGKGTINLTDAIVTDNNRYDVYYGGGESSAPKLTVSGLVKAGYYANYAWKLPIFVSGILSADSVIRVGVYDGIKPAYGSQLAIAEPASGVTLSAENFKADAADCVTSLGDDGKVYLARCAHKMDDTGYTCEKCKTQFDVRMGERDYYQTLAEAFQKAWDGSTITLMRDVTLTGNYSASDTITLDLHGKTITSGDKFFNVNEKLTVKDSSEGGGTQALNVKFSVGSNGTLAVDDSYTGKISRVELQTGGALEAYTGTIQELLLGKGNGTGYSVKLWKGNARCCTVKKITLDKKVDQALTVGDLLKTNHAKCELYGEKGGTWSVVPKTKKISELTDYTAYKVQFPECVHQCSDDTVANPVCSKCGKALVVKITATASSDGKTRTAWFPADSAIENGDGYVEAIQTLNGWSAEGYTDATLMPLCDVHNNSGGIGIASVTLTGKLAVDGGEHLINSTIIASGADVTFKTGQFRHITVNGKASFVGGTYLGGVTASSGAEAVFSGGAYKYLYVKDGGTAVVKNTAAFGDDVTVTKGTLTVEGGSFKAAVVVEGDGTMNVNGGRFTGADRLDRVEYSGGAKGTVSGGSFAELYLYGSGTAWLAGGSFAKLSTADSGVLSSLLADGAAYYDQSGNAISGSAVSELNNVTVKTHIHTVDEQTGICSVCKKQMAASLTVGNETSWYLTLDAAIKAANEGTGEKTLKLYQDVPTTAPSYELTRGPVTLDVNGKKAFSLIITVKGIQLTVTGEGTIRDVTASGSSAVVKNSTVNINYITAESGGRLELGDGSYMGLTVKNDGSSASLSGGTYKTIKWGQSYVPANEYLADGYGYKTSDGTWEDGTASVDNVTVTPAPIKSTKVYPNSETGYSGSTFDAKDSTSVTLTVSVTPDESAGLSYIWCRSINDEWRWLTNPSITQGLTEKYTGAGSQTLSITGLPADQTFSYKVQITTRDGYTCYSEPFTVTRHQHSWMYTASGATITAKCSQCDTSGGSVTIKAPDESTLTYTGQGHPATLENHLTTDAPVSAITYIQTAPTQQALESSAMPTNAGTYTASVTVGEGNKAATASVEYTIKKAIPTASDFIFRAPTDLTYNGTPKTAAVTPSKNGMGEVTVKYYQDETEVPPINAGKYIVKISVADGTNYEAVVDNLTDPDWEFTITKATYKNEITNGSAKFGTEGTVDLSSLIAEGGTAAFDRKTDNDGVLEGDPTVEGNTLKFKFKDSATKNQTATVDVKVTGAKNYGDYFIIVTLKVTEKKAQTPLKYTGPSTVTYGQTLQLTFTGGSGDGKMTYTNPNLEGAATIDENGLLTATRTGKVTIRADKAGDATYEGTFVIFDITVTKAPLTIKVLDKQIYVGEAAPDLTKPQKGTHYTVTGLVKEGDLKGTAVMKYQKDGKDIATPDTSKPGVYDITLTGLTTVFTHTAGDHDDYDLTIVPGKLTIQAQPSGGGGGGGSSSGSTVKTDTVTNPDGSTTKTETKSDGTVIETTTGKDGSVSKTTTNPNGSSVTESKDAAGSTGTVKTDKHGQTTAETTLSGKAVEDAKRNGEPVTAPVEVEASRNSNTAPTVKVELPKGTGETKVEIPVSNVKPGTVAVLVHADGTEEIVKNSLPTADGIQLTVNGGATFKIVDNSKDFIDTRNHWAKDAIDFVSARGLVNGMSATIYAPNNSTTRAQLWTILARQNNADLNGGATWFENAQNWAKEKGISDGTNPNGTINRAQMVTMLWRAMGQPAAASGASFADVPADSYYAQAVAWAVENGITAGVGNGRFDPNSTCTRGQIATFLYRLYLSR